MSRVWSARQVIDAARLDLAAVSTESMWYDERIREHDSDVAAIDRRIGEAWDHLCALLVPDLDAARLDALASSLGLPMIHAAAVEAGTRSEVARQQALRAAAEASPLYQNREGLRNECEILLVECDELLAPLRAVFVTIVDDPRFIRLRADGPKPPANGPWPMRRTLLPELRAEAVAEDNSIAAIRASIGGREWTPGDRPDLPDGRHVVEWVAVARDASQAAPLVGSFTGLPDDPLGMEVQVQVTTE